MASNRKPTRAELELLVHCQQQVLRRVEAYLFMAAQYQHSKHERAYTALLLEVMAATAWGDEMTGSEAA
jgi:hypothetical protein